jgi:hypothetical protein
MTTANAYRIVLLISMSAMGAATPAAATPVALLHWDDCNSGQLNKVFTGPVIYSQVITAEGFASAVRGHEVTLRLTAANLYNPERSIAGRRTDPAGCRAGRT